MADDRVTTSERAQARVDAYLNELAQRLHGPHRRRTRILGEIRDGLGQAITDQAAQGRNEDQAVQSAIDHFGAPQAVAAAFAGELTTASARRMIAWYIVTGPLVGIWWLLLLQPHPWRVGVLGLLAAIPILPLVAVATATAAGTFATTGRLIRWLPEASPDRATSAAIAIAALAATTDLAVTTLYLQSSASIPPLAILAIGCSVVRFLCSVVVIRHTIQIRRHAQPTGV